MLQQMSNSMQVVKREEKEVKLTQFVLSEIATGRVSVDGQWSVIALSMKSPVISALRRVVNDLGASSLRINVILTGRGKHTIADGFVTIEALSVRTGQSSHLVDAHEQLVLGDVSSWTGDCMRRDPMERDAFETFAANNTELAAWARKSFARLRSGAAPIHVSRSRDRVSETTDIDCVVAGEGAKASPLVAATSRH